MFKPIQLSSASLEPAVLAEDKKRCRRVGPCGLGEKALYLNSFYIDRRYYIPYSAITRVFKRVAMSKGGFTRKGVFASMAYLVVEYDGGKEKQCNFKYEEQVDQLLALLEQSHPEIKRVSAAAEKRLAEREKARRKEKKPELTPEARAEIARLEEASAFLEGRPELTLELSQAARRKRAYLCTNPSYRWVAMAITLLGVVSLGFGIYSILNGGGFAVYFLLLGLAAIFLFSGASVLPTAQNNRKVVMSRAQKAQKAMEDYLASRPDFPLPARYAHPVVLRRMVRALEYGRAANGEQALEVVKKDLQALNSSVEVDQEEYDEVVAIKAMFLNEDYR